MLQWAGQQEGTDHCRGQSYQAKNWKSQERSYFNSPVNRNWWCLKEKCSRSKGNNSLLVHSKLSDLEKTLELRGNTTFHTSTHPKADRPLSVPWTRITYHVPNPNPTWSLFLSNISILFDMKKDFPRLHHSLRSCRSLSLGSLLNCGKWRQLKASFDSGNAYLTP